MVKRFGEGEKRNVRDQIMYLVDKYYFQMYGQIY